MLEIPAPDENMRVSAQNRQARLTKPPGALGRLETLSIQLAGITGRLDWLPQRRAIIVCAGDHGVAAQGVSAFPQEVTRQMVLNFLNGGAAVNVLARQMGARIKVIDAGVIGSLDPHPDLIQGKIAAGTADFTQAPAMSDQQAQASIQLGMKSIQAEIASGLDIVAVGEMGIANTTAASAIIAAITGAAPADVTGRGTGLNDTQLDHKTHIIETALARHAPAKQNTLAKLGGFEIGAMAGVILGAAACRVPILLDGLISTAAALVAAQLAPGVTPYLIAGHCSVERGHQVALDWLGITPILSLDMRLGEGTGALLALPIVEAAMRTLQEMATFDAAGVSEA